MKLDNFAVMNFSPGANDLRQLFSLSPHAVAICVLIQCYAAKQSQPLGLVLVKQLKSSEQASEPTLLQLRNCVLEACPTRATAVEIFQHLWNELERVATSVDSLFDFVHSLEDLLMPSEGVAGEVFDGRMEATSLLGTPLRALIEAFDGADFAEQCRLCEDLKSYKAAIKPEDGFAGPLPVTRLHEYLATNLIEHVQVRTGRGGAAATAASLTSCLAHASDAQVLSPHLRCLFRSI